MSDQVYILLLDNLNNVIEKEKIQKPKTFEELLKILKNDFKKLADSFVIFYLSKNNEEKIINTEQNYVLSKDIIFIRNSDKKEIKQSIFSKIYSNLTESKQNLLDEKYSCFICSEFIKKEKPLFCYICQKIYHNKCLEDWEKKKLLQNENLKCPHCMNELPLNQWKRKLDYEENRKNEIEEIYLLNQYRLQCNLISNINLINEKKINLLKAENEAK